MASNLRRPIKFVSRYGQAIPQTAQIPLNELLSLFQRPSIFTRVRVRNGQFIPQLMSGPIALKSEFVSPINQ
jgi:hypothetical protein